MCTHFLRYLSVFVRSIFFMQCIFSMKNWVKNETKFLLSVNILFSSTDTVCGLRQFALNMVQTSREETIYVIEHPFLHFYYPIQFVYLFKRAPNVNPFGCLSMTNSNCRLYRRKSTKNGYLNKIQIFSYTAENNEISGKKSSHNSNTIHMKQNRKKSERNKRIRGLNTPAEKSSHHKS